MGAREPDAGASGTSRATPRWPPLRLVGRFDPPSVAAANEVGAESLRFAWSGSTIEARFTGASIAVRLRAAPLDPRRADVDGEARTIHTATPYTIEIDERAPFAINVSADRERYELVGGLASASPHVVRITREAEAFAGVHELLGFDLAPGGTFLPPRERKLRIEVVGDSISCGYGVLGESATCPFSFATERASVAYPGRLSHALDADVTTVCWSGRGVYRNYDGSTTGTMRDLFELTLPAPPQSRWSFAIAPAPDAVIVALGTNDVLGGGKIPLDLAAFDGAYVSFLERVRQVYPSAWIFMATSPMLASVQAAFRARLERVASRRTAAGDAKVALLPVDGDPPGWGLGCDSHPNQAMNARMAERIEAVLRSRLGGALGAVAVPPP